MANFPDSIYSPRTMVNRTGVVYDKDKTKVIYAEDFNKDRAEIVAIENTLGLNPEGTFTSVADRLDDIEASIPTDALSDLVEDTTPQLGGDLDSNGHAIVASDHGTASTDQVVNVCYGTGDPPTASNTTEGTLFIKYTA